MFFVKKGNIVSPVDGIHIPLSEVDDPVFSQGIVGDGVAVIPSGNTIVSPVDGVITMIAEQKHGIGITTEKGTVILIMGVGKQKLKKVYETKTSVKCKEVLIRGQ